MNMKNPNPRIPDYWVEGYNTVAKWRGVFGNYGITEKSTVRFLGAIKNQTAFEEGLQQTAQTETLQTVCIIKVYLKPKP